MSIDEILVAWILSKSLSPYIGGKLNEENMKTYMKKYEGIYEENIKKYEGNMKKQGLRRSSEFFQVPEPK